MPGNGTMEILGLLAIGFLILAILRVRVGDTDIQFVAQAVGRIERRFQSIDEKLERVEAQFRPTVKFEACSVCGGTGDKEIREEPPLVLAIRANLGKEVRAKK